MLSLLVTLPDTLQLTYCAPHPRLPAPTTRKGQHSRSSVAAEDGGGEGE